jgi:hypothetical protein
MAFVGFPAFSVTDPEFRLGPGHLCAVCDGVPHHALPFEDEDAYPHHLTLDALEKSGKSCALCALIYWAAGCSLVRYGGMVSFGPITLSSGVQASAELTESIYNKFGMHALENGGMMMDFSDPVPDYRPPIQADLKLTFPRGTVEKDGEERPVRPWVFGNWYKSPIGDRGQLLMVGLGVRLGTSGKIEDAIDCSVDNVKLRGSYLRYRTDQGATCQASVTETLNLTNL